jgi:hypothetical protein
LVLILEFWAKKKPPEGGYKNFGYSGIIVDSPLDRSFFG